jgi:hypothetical protein
MPDTFTTVYLVAIGASMTGIKSRRLSGLGQSCRHQRMAFVGQCPRVSEKPTVETQRALDPSLESALCRPGQHSAISGPRGSRAFDWKLCARDFQPQHWHFQELP